MRKYLIGGLAMLLALTIVGTAAGKSTFTSNGHEQGLDLAIEKGGKQLTARSGPLAVEGEDYQNPDTVPEKAGRVQLLFDEGIKLNANKFPACSAADRALLEGTSSARAKELCGHAQVSLDGPANSEATAAIGFGGGATAVNPEVTAFNGPKMNGNPTLILHAFLSSPVANTTVLDGELKKVGGRTLLDVDRIPPLAGGLGALTDFFATINKTTKDKKAIKKAKKKLKKANKKFKKAKKKGSKKAKKKAKKKQKKAKKKLKKAKRKRISYIQAKCTGGSYETNGTWNMGEYTDPNDLNSFETKFVIRGQDSVLCQNNSNTNIPFDPGPGRAGHQG